MTVNFTDLDQGIEMTIFVSILINFKASIFFETAMEVSSLKSNHQKQI
jgi:hypothetical protein